MPLQGNQEHADYESIYDVDEKSSDERHDQEREGEGPWRWVTAVMLAMAVGVAPSPNPMKPAVTTAAS